jgi:hypothetical protein
MPTGFVKKMADKYDISVKKAEKEWSDSKKITQKQYGEASESPRTKKGKTRNSKIYGTTTNIFKSKMKAHHENLITNFEDFVNENYK